MTLKKLFTSKTEKLILNIEVPATLMASWEGLSEEQAGHLMTTLPWFFLKGNTLVKSGTIFIFFSEKNIMLSRS